MKHFSFLIFLFTLLSICFSEENIEDKTTKENNAVEENKTNGEKKLGISEQLLNYLDSLKNLKEISRDELYEIFTNIFDLIINDPIQSKNETKIEIISNFTNEVFELLVDKEKNVIVVEDTFGKFNTKVITDFISRFFKELNIEKILSNFLKAILKVLGEMLLKLFKNTDL